MSLPVGCGAGLGWGSSRAQLRKATEGRKEPWPGIRDDANK